MLNRRTLPIIDDDDPIWIDKVTRKFLNMTPMSFPSKSHFGSPKPWRKLPLGIKIIQNRRTGPIRQRVHKKGSQLRTRRTSAFGDQPINDVSNRLI